MSTENISAPKIAWWLLGIVTMCFMATAGLLVNTTLNRITQLEQIAKDIPKMAQQITDIDDQVKSFCGTKNQ